MPTDCIYFIKDISIHSSRAGGDSIQLPADLAISRFQSTPPVREETNDRTNRHLGASTISIHSSRAGGDGRCLYLMS